MKYKKLIILFSIFFIHSFLFPATDSTTFNITVTNNDVDWCNLQHPANDTIFLGNEYNVYARVFEDGITNPTGKGDYISAWIGYSSTDSDPSGSDWTWISATYNIDVDNNDEYIINLGGEINSTGTYYYASRFSLDSTHFKYGGYNANGGGFYDGISNINGVLVVRINNAPTLSSIANQTLTEDNSKIIILSATDSDSDPITFSVVGGTAESVLGNISNDTLTLTPTNNYFTSDSILFTVTADDGNGGTDEKSFKIVVTAVNDAPQIDSITNKEGIEGETLSFTISATDIDNNLLYWKAENLPTGATFTDNNDKSATFSWTPSFTQSGIYENILFIVNDEDGGSSTLTIKPQTDPKSLNK